jgi:hypothetical protein
MSQGQGPAGREGLVEWASIVLALAGVALLPWPGLGVGPGRLWVSWSLLEASFLLPLVPALLSGAAMVARPAAREAQLGALGRALVWLALGLSTGLDATGGLGGVAARVLALAAVAIAMPAALGWGPFGPLPGWPGLSTAAGLPPAQQRSATLSRRVRTEALLVVAFALTLPTPINFPQRTLLAVAAGVALAAVLSSLGRRFAGRWPRLALPDALGLTLLRALPLAIAAIIVAAIALGR